MAIKAVVFDAFGTLCEIGTRKRPFAKLARSHPDTHLARHLIMSRPLTLQDAANELGIEDVNLPDLERDLAAELGSIRLFPEVPDVLRSLRRKGLPIAIASNLALPYAAALRRLLPFELDTYGWSFEVGFVKPDARIYRHVCEKLGVAPSEALMVGDTYLDDYQGAMACGLQALRLVRGTEAASPDCVSSLTTIPELVDRHTALPVQ